MAYDADKCLTYSDFMTSIMDLGILRAETIEGEEAGEFCNVNNLVELRYSGINLTAKWTKTIVTTADGSAFHARSLQPTFAYDYTANRPYFNDGTYESSATHYMKFIKANGEVVEQYNEASKLKFTHSTTDTGYRLVASGGSIMNIMAWVPDQTSNLAGETFIMSVGFAYFEHVIDL